MIKNIAICVLLLICISQSDARNKIGKENDSEVDLKLKSLNRPPVKSIKSSDGDIIDCVDIYKQPAFDHPALRNHTFQLKPTFRIANNQNKSNSNPKEFGLTQTWQKNGSCPNGTIPIRRVGRQDLLRADSLELFGKKSPHHYFNAENNNDVVFVNSTNFTLAGQPNRSVAFLLTVGYNYIGAEGDLNLWNPRVASNDEYTTSQIWLKHGPAASFESVEAGWTVNPKVYGDTQSRLFVYWTTDSYKSTGCFDLFCQGFVHTNPQLALGAVLEPWSSEMGTQYQVSYSIKLDPDTGNWWVKVGHDVVLGYFPAELFIYLRNSAILVQWGGEVYSESVKKSPHTTTAMGSGEAASLMEGSSCYIKGVRIVDYSLSLKYPERVYSWADEPYCYSAFNYVKGYMDEPVFFFGGPGRSTLCP